MNKRSSGILIHITSLPSIHGIGDFGPTAYEFIDLLTQSGQKYWQVLPLNPTEATYGHSPYSCPSTFAGNPLLISPELLKKDGYLSDSDLSDPPDFSQDSVDFEAAALYKMEILKKAFESNIRGIAQYSDFKKFCKQNNHWLEDYCLYCSIKNDSNYVTWRDFPIELRDRHTICLAKWSEQEKHFILFYKFLQYIFFKQWFSLKKYANDKGIRIIGDIPYYINYDSSDVWANQQLFKLDNDKRPEFVAGVPPDYFSETGQLWG
ncbi:MAG: 4-alpha-glucanotransferase, partial [Thermodesulfobacteriota bacterium]